MSADDEACLDRARAILLAEEDPSLRLELWQALLEGYCTHCGSEHHQEYNLRGCQCWNDE